MPNRSYIRGRNFEWEVQKNHLNAGALMSFRTAGSHGAFDIVSFFPETQTVILTQCKTKLTDKKGQAGKVIQSEREEWQGSYRVITHKLTKFIRRRK